MSHFYGIIDGTGRTTRRGHKNTGLTSTAASWQGSVVVDLHEEEGVDYAHVYLSPWRGQGTSKTLYQGPVSGLST